MVLVLDREDIPQNKAQGVLSPLKVRTLDDHCLSGHIGHLDGVVHQDVVDLRFLNDLLPLTLRGNAFSKIFVFNENSEWKNFSLIRIEILLAGICPVVYFEAFRSLAAKRPAFVPSWLPPVELVIYFALVHFFILVLVIVEADVLLAAFGQLARIKIISASIWHEFVAGSPCSRRAPGARDWHPHRGTALIPKFIGRPRPALSAIYPLDVLVVGRGRHAGAVPPKALPDLAAVVLILVVSLDLLFGESFPSFHLECYNI